MNSALALWCCSSFHIIQVSCQRDELGSGLVVLLLLSLEHLHHEHLHHHPVPVQHRGEVPVLVVGLGEDNLEGLAIPSVSTRRKSLWCRWNQFNNSFKQLFCFVLWIFQECGVENP